jgi:hypothetical protein
VDLDVCPPPQSNLLPLRDFPVSTRHASEAERPREARSREAAFPLALYGLARSACSLGSRYLYESQSARPTPDAHTLLTLRYESRARNVQRPKKRSTYGRTSMQPVHLPCCICISCRIAGGAGVARRSSFAHTRSTLARALTRSRPSIPHRLVPPPKLHACISPSAPRHELTADHGASRPSFLCIWTYGCLPPG